MAPATQMPARAKMAAEQGKVERMPRAAATIAPRIGPMALPKAVALALRPMVELCLPSGAEVAMMALAMGIMPP